MCRVYNTIGCLNTLQLELVKNNIDEFNTLDEIIHFQKNYHLYREQIISNHQKIIEQEKIYIENEISELNNLISERITDLEEELRQKLDYLNQEIETLFKINSKVITAIKDYWTNLLIHIKFWLLQIQFSFKIILFKYRAKKLLSEKNKRFEYLNENFQNAVNESSITDLQKCESKNETITSLNNTIYGAIGEQKVQNTLKKLPDNCILINDFCCSFNPPIYNKSTNDHIYSIQIDHLLISPAGIFIIETKNWSDKSINNPNLRSPVEQILRTNFALFILLSNNTGNINKLFFEYSWGNRKVPIKNIIAFTNNKPIEQFQFVKIVTLDELIPYIKYFNASFLEDEIEMIANFLLHFSKQRKNYSKLSIQ